MFFLNSLFLFSFHHLNFINESFYCLLHLLEPGFGFGFGFDLIIVKFLFPFISLSETPFHSLNSLLFPS